MESKKARLIEQRAEWWLPGVGVWEKWRVVDQRVQTSSYKMNKSGDVTYSIVTIVNNTALYT